MDRWGEEAIRERDAEIARLRALVAEAAEIMEGDGEYPAQARRMRAALEQNAVDPYRAAVDEINGTKRR